jgi:hypothetical protein
MQKSCPPPHAFAPVLLAAAAVALLGASPSAQSDLKSRLKPITSPFRRAGVYHVATGTWTLNGQLANLTGPDIIYNNSCSEGGYFLFMTTGEKWQHRSRVPTTAANGAPTTQNFFDPAKNDEAPGCDTSYLVNGFQIVYCSERPSTLGPFDQDYEFASAYLSCGVSDMVPDVTFHVTGLPGGTATGQQICWIVDVDLDAASASFTLMADQDGTWTGPSTSEQFGYSQGPTTPGITTAQATGPVLAGNYFWTGGPFVGPLTPCSGTDGTIWDSPVNLAEEGSGMSSADFVRITGNPQITPGCYFFTHDVHPDVYLKLFSDAPDCPPIEPGITFCEPGLSGVMPCLCGNPPSGPERGCNNSAGTGGASLTDLGVASLSNDTLVFTTSAERPTALSIVLGGNIELPSGVTFGDGVRCTGGILLRLYVKSAVGGSITAPSGLDPSVSVRSATIGSPIVPAQTRLYQVYYRDPLSFGCEAGPGGTGATFNATSGRRVFWDA